jgi:hypothetical protein
MDTGNGCCRSRSLGVLVSPAARPAWRCNNDLALSVLAPVTAGELPTPGIVVVSAAPSNLPSSRRAEGLLTTTDCQRTGRLGDGQEAV